jgi:hypothetical protein
MPPRPRAEGAEHTSPGQSREAGAALRSWRKILGRPARAAANGPSSGRCHSRWRQRITLPRMACGVWAAPLQGAGAPEDINPGRRATALALGWPAARRWRAKCPDSSNRSQIATGSQKHRDPRLLPYAFTEHGAIMAANILNSPRAVQINDELPFRRP